MKINGDKEYYISKKQKNGRNFHYDRTPNGLPIAM